MAWDQTLYLGGKGSYNGFEFAVSTVSSTIGRKTTTHDFPARSFPAVEDLGRSARTFELSCYLVGHDYFVGREDLKSEFEKPGPGQLVHPTWGEFKVAIISPVKMTESFAEGGMVRFDLQLVEVDDPLLLTVIVAEPGVRPLALILTGFLAEDFEKKFSLTGAIQAIRAAAVSAIESAAQTMREARGAVNAALDVVNDVASAIDDLSNLASTLINSPALLMQNIATAYEGIFDDISDITTEVADLLSSGQQSIEAVNGSSLFMDFRASRALEAFNTLTESLSTLPAVQDVGSTQNTIEAANQAALQEAFQTSAAIAACVSFATLDFESRNKALEVREVITAKIAALAENASDTVYGPLMDLRASISTHLLTVSQTLPQIIEVEIQEAQPSLVVMYDIHGGLANEAGFLERNRIEDPTAVPALVPLEVLANG